MEVEIKAEGFKELMESLDTLCTPGIQKKLIQNAVKEAARPVKADAELRLGKDKGYIAAGMPRRRYWGADTIASIGIGLVAKHWPLIFREYGTIERYTKKKARRGKIMAHPFLRPALDSKKNEALDRMKSYLELALKVFFEEKGKTVPPVPEVE